MYLTYDPENGLVRHEGVPTLEQMQEVVGGLIEPVSLFQQSPHVEAHLYVNEEGLYMCEPTFFFDGPEGLRAYNGNFVMVATDFRTGETVSLTEVAAERITMERQLVLLGAAGISTLQLPLLEVL